jgi:hypothetical protein
MLDGMIAGVALASFFEFVGMAVCLMLAGTFLYHLADTREPPS